MTPQLYREIMACFPTGVAIVTAHEAGGRPRGLTLSAFCAVSGALFLYGMAILLAQAHSLNIYEIHQALVKTPLPHGKTLVIFGLVFISFTFQLASMRYQPSASVSILLPTAAR